MNINIYPMTQQDFNTISPILSAEFDDFWTISALKSELGNPNSSYIVAKLNSEIVGFAGIWKAVDEVHIMDIVVKKNYRHQGIGKILLEELFRLTKELGFHVITLEVNAQNTIAQKLYLHYNFKEVRDSKKLLWYWARCLNLYLTCIDKI